MVRELGKAHGGVFVEEEERIADKYCNHDAAKNPREPVACNECAMAEESLADGMGRGESGRVGCSVGSQSTAMRRAGGPQKLRGGEDLPAEWVQQVPDHPSIV